MRIGRRGLGGTRNDRLDRRGKFREKRGVKEMTRRTLSMKEQLTGVTAALKSPRTPSQLRPSLRKRKEALEKALAEQSSKIKTKRNPSVFSF
jgi:hypothetical protein